MSNYFDKYMKYKAKYLSLKGGDDKQVLYHGSSIQFDIGKPSLTTRLGTLDEPTRIKYKGFSFHVTPERYIALAYTYNKKDMKNVGMGVSLYDKDKTIFIYGDTDLEDSLHKLYGNGGYLYEFEDNNWFVWFQGLGNLEKITFNEVKPIKSTFIEDPVVEMKKEGVEFVFNKYSTLE